MRNALTALLSLCLLTACATTDSLVKLRHAAPTDDPYKTALASRYQQFAEEKVARCDWWTSKYFADKGLMAAYGREVGPEDPANWDIDEGVRDDFAAARAQLNTALANGRSARPALAAEAVVAFDRWLELSEDGWNLPKIEEARDDFFAAISQLPANETPAEKTASDTSPGAVIETTSAILYFPFDSDAMTDNTVASLDEIVAYIKNSGGAQIAINGHADRAGSDSYNMALSERRAKLVMDALIGAGIPAERIQYFAFGETDPKVATEDGMEEALNRRVEIFLE